MGTYHPSDSLDTVLLLVQLDPLLTRLEVHDAHDGSAESVNGSSHHDHGGHHHHHHPFLLLLPPPQPLNYRRPNKSSLAGKVSHTHTHTRRPLDNKTPASPIDDQLLPICGGSATVPSSFASRSISCWHLMSRKSENVRGMDPWTLVSVHEHTHTYTHTHFVLKEMRRSTISYEAYPETTSIWSHSCTSATIRS